MSSKPYPEAIASLIELLDRQRQLNAEIAELEPKVENLRLAREESQKNRATLSKLLRDCDLLEGNAGWEGRLTYALMEMRRQVTRGAV